MPAQGMHGGFMCCAKARLCGKVHGAVVAWRGIALKAGGKGRLCGQWNCAARRANSSNAIAHDKAWYLLLGKYGSYHSNVAHGTAMLLAPRVPVFGSDRLFACEWRQTLMHLALRVTLRAFASMNIRCEHV
ncbi:hypothetical protein NPIL_426311 [Nephila pilipes]|uniref:Uncharacterized protein n=1 Tax=Nephila pilipes TaxID=299642 RepID=A0A8X6NDX9_NEPPI|nr:hypothetical protein NPIL_426311 [Nephila pilipes]